MNLRQLFLPFSVNCTWSSWEAWTPCSVTCGQGTRQKSRYVAQNALHGGASCSGISTESETCSSANCTESPGMQAENFLSNSFLRIRLNQFSPLSVHCTWSAWEAWTPCSVTCGHGTRQKSRYVSQNALHGGAPCTGISTESESCNMANCTESPGMYANSVISIFFL